MVSKIEEIIQSITQKDTAIFVGAGISYNSGLPLANMLKRAILENISHDPDLINDIMKIEIPFELFMEILSNSVDIYPILEFFKIGKANTNHQLIAKLAKYGMVSTIVTTNFDILMENALASEKISFDIFYTPEVFSRLIQKPFNQRVMLIKLHGSADNIESIQTTLKSVVNSTNSDNISEVIRYIFSTGPHSQVLILGYSCSDFFDICPAIENITTDQKNIVFIEHSNNTLESGKDDYKIEKIWIQKEKNPFKLYTGDRVYINTDVFCKRLWEFNKNKFGYYEYRTSKSIWKSYIEENLTKVEFFPVNLFLGDIYLAISQPNKAIHYFKDGVINGYAMEQVYGSIGLGNAYGKIGDINEGIINFKKALTLADDWNDPMAKILCYFGMGLSYISLGNLGEAKECINLAAEICRRDSDLFPKYSNMIQFYLNEIEQREKMPVFESVFEKMNWEFDSNTERSEENFLNKGLEQSKLDGKTEDIILHFYETGDLYLTQKKYEKAKAEFLKGLDWAKKVNVREYITKITAKLGILSYRNNALPDAIDYFLNAKKCAEEIEDSSLILSSIVGLGDSYHKLRRFDEALNYYQMGLKIAEKNCDKEKMGDCYLGLGNTYRLMGNMTCSVEKYKAGLKIAEKSGDKLLQSAILNEMNNLEMNKAIGLNIEDIKTSIINQFDCEIINLILKSIDSEKKQSLILYSLDLFYNKDYQKSIEFLLMVIKLDNKFNSFDELNRFVKNKSNLKELTDLSKDIRLALLIMGLSYEKMGNHNIAEDCVLNASYSCNDPHIRILVGQFYLECQEPDFNFSVNTFINACMVDPDCIKKCDDLWQNFLKKTPTLCGYIDLPMVCKRWDDFKSRMSIQFN